MGTLPFLSAADLITIGSVGEDVVVLRAGDVDLCVIYGDPKRTGERLIEVGACIVSVAPEVYPPEPSPTPSLVAVDDLRRGDRVALDRCDSTEAPAPHSMSWATVTDVVRMAGRVATIMVRTDAVARANRVLAPDVQVWAMRPTAATEEAVA
jgi:hypothetical protein